MKNNVFLFAFVVSGQLISDLGPQGGIGGRPKLKLIHGSAVSRIYYMIFFTCFFRPLGLCAVAPCCSGLRQARRPLCRHTRVLERAATRQQPPTAPRLFSIAAFRRQLQLSRHPPWMWSRGQHIFTCTSCCGDHPSMQHASCKRAYLSFWLPLLQCLVACTCVWQVRLHV